MEGKKKKLNRKSSILFVSLYPFLNKQNGRMKRRRWETNEESEDKKRRKKKEAKMERKV